MATPWTLGCDAIDPPRIAAFWAEALGYVAETAYDDAESASIIDPDGRGPAIGGAPRRAFRRDRDGRATLGT
jgi:Glyoxalase-like domain